MYRRRTRDRIPSALLPPADGRANSDGCRRRFSRNRGAGRSCSREFSLNLELPRELPRRLYADRHRSSFAIRHVQRKSKRCTPANPSCCRSMKACIFLRHPIPSAPVLRRNGSGRRLLNRQWFFLFEELVFVDLSLILLRSGIDLRKWKTAQTR